MSIVISLPEIVAVNGLIELLILAIDATVELIAMSGSESLKANRHITNPTFDAHRYFWFCSMNDDGVVIFDNSTFD